MNKPLSPDVILRFYSDPDCRKQVLQHFRPLILYYSSRGGKLDMDEVEFLESAALYAISRFDFYLHP